MNRPLTLAEHFAFQQSLFHPVLRMMLRGVKLDYGRRSTLRTELLDAAMNRQDLLNFMAGHPLNPKSPKKMMQFFYEDLRIPGIKHLKEDRLTLDSNALDVIATREPLLLPLCQCVAELRSIGVFLSNFIEAEPDIDGRMRCSFAVAGPITYRFASFKNAFGSGMNLQNLPKKEKKKIKNAKNYVQLPNIRELFVPDYGFTYFDLDLDRADLQVVVWEADDKDLKMVLREGIDMHCFNACDVFGIKGIPPDELKETHPNYPEHRARIGEFNRDKAKNGVHACDYGVGDHKLAMTLGITVHAASRFKVNWFAKHPGFLRWHKRVEETVRKQKYLSNMFGARLYNWGHFDLPEFLAWGPQSTVAGVINRGLKAIDEAEQAGKTKIQLQLQVHDSLAGQFPSGERDASLSDLRMLTSITIPYEDPLVIPVGIKTSNESWGKCK